MNDPVETYLEYKIRTFKNIEIEFRELLAKINGGSMHLNDKEELKNKLIKIIHQNDIRRQV